MSKFFSLTILPKKIMDKMGGGRECYTFPYNKCCLTVPKNLVGEPFSVSEIPCYRKRNLREEDIMIFKQRMAAFPLDSFVSHSTGIFVVETFNVSGKFWGIEKFSAYWGIITIFHRMF